MTIVVILMEDVIHFTLLLFHGDHRLRLFFIITKKSNIVIGHFSRDSRWDWNLVKKKLWGMQ